MENTNEAPKELYVNEDSIAKINVFCEEAELEPYKKFYVQEKQKSATIKGFRKGKAPIEMIASLYKDEARNVATQNLIYAKYMKVLQDHKLKPLAKPTLDDMSDVLGKIDAKLSVEVLQPVMLGQYLGLELQKFPVKSVEDGVKKALDDIRAAYPKLEEVAEPVQNERVVVVDFIMSIDGKVVEEQKDFKIAVGVDMYFKAFEENLIGLSAEQSKEFDVLFPDTYSQENLRNKNAHFVVFVKKVQKVLDYTDQELAKLINFETADKMMEFIKNDVETKYNDEKRLYYENQILGQLLEAHRFKIPTTLINNEKERIKAEKNDLTPEQIDDFADKFIRTDLICHSIYERHPECQLDKESLEDKFKKLAERANDSIENIKKKLQESGKLQSYLNYLVNNQVVDFLIEMADIKDVEMVVAKEEVVK